MVESILNYWCERGDLNPHGFTRQILSLVRLPIPPLSQGCCLGSLLAIVTSFCQEVSPPLPRSQRFPHFRVIKK